MQSSLLLLALTLAAPAPVPDVGPAPTPDVGPAADGGPQPDAGPVVPALELKTFRLGRRNLVSALVEEGVEYEEAQAFFYATRKTKERSEGVSFRRLSDKLLITLRLRGGALDFVELRREYASEAPDVTRLSLSGEGEERSWAQRKVDFAVEVASGKYLDHLPLARQVKIMAREGLVVDTQTLWDQIEALAGHLQPSYEALADYVLSHPVLHADETPWPLLGKGGKKRWYAWCAAVPDGVVYRILQGRSAQQAEKLLGAYDGVVVADGYAAYDKLSRDGPGSFTLAYCWAHVRRKFVEAEKFYPRDAAEILELIGKLFAIERQAPDPWLLEDKERKVALATRLKLRQENAKPVLDQILAWARRQQTLPQSTMRKAIKYMLNQWAGLVRFVDNPRIPIHNNLAEREMRRPVLGRKNHYGSRSRRGTEVAALFYSLLESAQLVGSEPKAYLSQAATNAIKSPGAITLPQQS